MSAPSSAFHVHPGPSSSNSHSPRGPSFPSSGSSSATYNSPSSPKPQGLSSPIRSDFQLNSLSRSLDQAMGALPPNVSPSRTSMSSSNTNRLPGPEDSRNGYANSTSSSTTRQGSIDSLQNRPAAPRNPLIDLLETEKTYVEELAMVIKVSLHLETFTSHGRRER